MRTHLQFITYLLLFIILLLELFIISQMFLAFYFLKQINCHRFFFLVFSFSFLKQEMIKRNEGIWEKIVKENQLQKMGLRIFISFCFLVMGSRDQKKIFFFTENRRLATLVPASKNFKNFENLYRSPIIRDLKKYFFKIKYKMYCIKYE